MLGLLHHRMHGMELYKRRVFVELERFESPPPDEFHVCDEM